MCVCTCVCVMRVDVGTDEINCPTVEARWWVHGGGYYTILSIFKKYVWTISSQKGLWRLTPASSTLSFPSPHPEGVCHSDITVVAVISHVRPLHTGPSVQGSFPPFLTVHPSGSVISQPRTRTLITAGSYHIATVYFSASRAGLCPFQDTSLPP